MGDLRVAKYLYAYIDEKVQKRIVTLLSFLDSLLGLL